MKLFVSFCFLSSRHSEKCGCHWTQSRQCQVTKYNPRWASRYGRLTHETESRIGRMGPNFVLDGDANYSETAACIGPASSPSKTIFFNSSPQIATLHKFLKLRHKCFPLPCVQSVCVCVCQYTFPVSYCRPDTGRAQAVQKWRLTVVKVSLKLHKITAVQFSKATAIPILISAFRRSLYQIIALLIFNPPYIASSSPTLRTIGPLFKGQAIQGRLFRNVGNNPYMLRKIPEDSFPLIAHLNLICYARIQSITAVGLLLKFRVFWDVTLCGWDVVSRRFGGSCFLHHYYYAFLKECLDCLTL